MPGQTVHYTPLPQSTASDEEDGVWEPSPQARAGSSPADHPESIELTDLRFAKPGAPRAVRKWGFHCRKVVVVVLLVCVLVVGAIGAAIFAFLSHEFNTGVVHDVHFIPQRDWTLFYNQSASESGVTLVDVDGDGLEDILVGVTKVKDAENPPFSSETTAKESCLKMGFQYPCVSQVVALRGYDGKELWRTWMRYSLLFVNCDGIDVDGDQRADCIFSGRYSALQAVDLATGKIHWAIDAENETWTHHFVPKWLVCRALSIPDVDGDGIQDILVAHGGDPDKEPEEHDRASGRVVFLSGRTGDPVGRYLPMPDDRETYMSPVRYQTANHTAFILLGSGGETVSGDLMIISYTDLCDYVMDNKPPLLRTLYRGREKGVLVSPVLVDITGDGTLDILMSSFEGVVTLFNGETLEEVWSVQLTSPQNPSVESYSVPAPGRFDEDDVPDFMMMWGRGRWPNYHDATVYILSGVDGSILWQRQSQMVPWYSALSLRSAGSHDLFIMRTVAVTKASSASPPITGARGTQHLTGQRGKRHMEAHRNRTEDGSWVDDGSLESFQQMCETSRENYEQEYKTCSTDLSQWKAEVSVMDRAHSDSPQSIHTARPLPFRYSLPVREGSRHCHQLSPIDRNLVDVCVVMEVKGLTGGLGDVDGDGEVDLVQVESAEAQVITDSYEYNHMSSDVVLSRLSVASILQGEVELVPMEDQPWRQFMGSSKDGVYQVPDGKDRSLDQKGG